jgi:glucose/mannose-6-phosphate isomerase
MAAHPLDDRSFVTRLDPKGMFHLTEAFPNQCRQALAVAESAELPTLHQQPSLVMLTGLGGSAAGGDFTKALFEAQSTVPFLVNRDYHLPAYVNEKTLIIACSYSGNTEETLSAYADAKSAGATVIVVTSGGKLAELARSDGFSVIQIPAGQPPRTALGFLLIPVVSLCVRLSLLPEQDFEAAFARIDATVQEQTVEVPVGSNPSKALAIALHGKLSVLYGLGSYPAIVANRWKGQINENAKNMTFANAFPELNHNEILGWVKANEQGVQNWIGVILQDGSESPQLKKRAEVTQRLVGQTAKFVTVTATGPNLLAKMLDLTLFGDFVSLYLAALNGVDPENIDSINILKSELAQLAP